MPIEFAEQERISAVYEEALALIWFGLEIKAAILTDLSSVSDFGPDEEDLDKLSALVGRRVGRHDPIVELAEEYSAKLAKEYPTN